jgi:sugar/nucleoside kinase (ribokinase family)
MGPWVKPEGDGFKGGCVKKALTIGGATLDTIIEYEDMETLVHERTGHAQSYLLLEEGNKIEVTAQKTFSGGGATNAAVSLNKQGFEVSIFCKIGQDYAGDAVTQELSSFGIDTQYTVKAQTCGTATSYVVPSLSGDRTIFAYRGASTTLMATDLPETAISGADFIYITSLSQAAAEQLPGLVERANKHNVPVAINPGISQLKLGASFLEKALSGIHTFILNYDEAKQFMASLMHVDDVVRARVEQDLGVGEDKFLDEAIRFEDVRFSLRQFFTTILGLGVKVVVVTDGSNGVYVSTDDELYFHKSSKVDVVNTLGAGDAFGSSFVGAYQQGMNIPDAIRAGIVNSASVIAHSDAKSGLLSQSDIAAKMATLSESDLKVLHRE